MVAWELCIYIINDIKYGKYNHVTDLVKKLVE